MFPNVRLTVVAILATIAGIACGLGLFATFRVNHEPLARLAEGSPPLQLGLDKLGLNSPARGPMEARLPVGDAAKVIPVPVVVATPIPDRAETDAGIGADSAAVQRALGEPAEEDQSSTTNLATVAPNEQPGTTREEPVAARPEQDALAPTDGQEPSAAPIEPAASGSDAAGEKQTAAIDAAAPDAVAPDEQPKAPRSEPAASTLPESSAEQTAALNRIATVQEPTAKRAKSIEKKAVKPAAKAARAAPARRGARAVHPRRATTAAAARPAAQYSQSYAQPSYTQPPAYTQPGSAQPTYSWADGQAAQSVKRAQVRHNRAVKRTAPAAQSNPFPATAGLSGSQ